jgi:acetolactate synthase I/II/III large subunit
MRVVDYVAEAIYREGVSQIFMVSGGGNMYLTDGIATHRGLNGVCMHHEQAAAMAAVGYAKYTGNLGACYVTTGCGGTNAVTGVLNAWQDGTPCIFVSGQSKLAETIRNSGLRLRQFGVQEADIVSIVQSITKYAITITKPELVAYHVEKALFLAREGRKGPVWLDVPLDVQGAEIDTPKLLRFSPMAFPDLGCATVTEKEVTDLLEFIKSASRPIVLAGQGIRSANAVTEFRQFIERFQIPFVVSKLGIDLLPTDHDLFIGRIGNKGDRPGNLAIQNSDLLISIGCRLSVSSTGHQYETFAREANIVVVDIDPVEHQKKTIRIDSFIHADAKDFLTKLCAMEPPAPTKGWAETCLRWKQKYPVFRESYRDDTAGINLYHFIECLSEVMEDGSVVVSDAGSSFYVVTQALRLKEGQRSITSGGQAEMGYTLPAAIGACYAREKTNVIGVTGDGSFQMNIQELQTVVHNRLPIKLFVWNNDGYLSIRATQRRFFEGRFIGTDASSGLSFPSVQNIAQAYGIKFVRLEHGQNLEEGMRSILEYSGPVLCEVMCNPDQEIVPSVASYRKEDGTIVSRPLEDMYPFLDREEFRSEMIIRPLDV